MIFEVYQDRSMEWRWRLVSTRNGKILADSGEGYKSRANALRAARRLDKHFVDALEVVAVPPVLRGNV